ncbi:hypothetical protein EVAR_10118_1 [Eumeta japonica]|uniref:Uncharacterized protein n=1 Tax=Eumeta variegata TaxID=151549 RepID=A0A4C1UD17_EUMVA|nr:hypothetical protein EVAR_10118_1 [Eumeta japonica]
MDLKIFKSTLVAMTILIGQRRILSGVNLNIFESTLADNGNTNRRTESPKRRKAAEKKDWLGNIEPVHYVIRKSLFRAAEFRALCCTGTVHIVFDAYTYNARIRDTCNLSLVEMITAGEERFAISDRELDVTACESLQIGGWKTCVCPDFLQFGTTVDSGIGGESEMGSSVKSQDREGG